MKKIKVHDIELAYRDEGNGDVIIFAHAFALNQKMWDEQVTIFSKTNRVITFDWRGFGESQYISNKISMDDLADDLAGIIQSLSLKKFTLCSLSMGGYAAFAFLRKYPEIFAEKISSLILADTKATIENDEGKKNRIEMADLAVKSGSEKIAEMVLPKWVSPKTLKNKSQVVEKVKSMISGTKPEIISAAQLGMAERLDAVEMLSQISCPTLIIVGDEDNLTPLFESEKMAGKIQLSSLVKISDSGHLSNLEQPEKFNLAITSFLNN